MPSTVFVTSCIFVAVCWSIVTCLRFGTTSKASTVSITMLQQSATSVTAIETTASASGTGRRAPRLVAIIPNNTSPSFFRSKPLNEEVSWGEVLEKLNQKLGWESLNDKYNASTGVLGLEVLTLSDLENNQEVSQVVKDTRVGADVDVLALIGLNSVSQTQFGLLQSMSNAATSVTAHDCSSDVLSLEHYGLFYPSNEPSAGGFVADIIDKLFTTARRKEKIVYETVREVWERKSLDDLLFLFYVLVDTFTSFEVSSVKAVTTTESTGLSQIQCMAGNCGKEMIDCFKDENCRKALDCLNKCRNNDQVCSYKCITTYESEIFEKFALCILQKNNCMCNSATIPSYPDPKPLATFRGEPLTVRTAEDIFIGHLQLRPGELNPMFDADYKSSLSEAASTIVQQGLSRNNANGSSEQRLLPWSWKVVCKLHFYDILFFLYRLILASIVKIDLYSLTDADTLHHRWSKSCL